MVMTPALFTKASIRPNAVAVSSKSRVTSFACETSARTAIARPPAVVIAATTSSADFWLPAKLTTTLQPSAARPQGDCPADAA
jgi:hypothetical protein